MFRVGHGHPPVFPGGGKKSDPGFLLVIANGRKWGRKEKGTNGRTLEGDERDEIL